MADVNWRVTIFSPFSRLFRVESSLFNFSSFLSFSRTDPSPFGVSLIFLVLEFWKENFQKNIREKIQSFLFLDIGKIARGGNGTRLANGFVTYRREIPYLIFMNDVEHHVSQLNCRLKPKVDYCSGRALVLFLESQVLTFGKDSCLTSISFLKKLAVITYVFLHTTFFHACPCILVLSSDY